MTDRSIHKEILSRKGFTIIKYIYTATETEQIITCINSTDSTQPTFRRSKDLFAIRQFLKEIPKIVDLIFNENLKNLVDEICGPDFNVIKSIYFDKPEESNWFVAYHQDLTISTGRKEEIAGYGPWTVKQDQFAVQPPLEILENIFAFRIHLDNTNINNGALKVIPGSHLKGICRPDTLDLTKEKEEICDVEKGSVMIMKPLLLHSSGRSIGNSARRVIHVELSNKVLPEPLLWSEYKKIDRV